MVLNLASIGSVYESAIVDTGRQPELLFLLAFLGSFGFIRTSTHMIKAQVSWWPGNVSVGGTHIHHMVWGILTMLIVGYIGVTIAPPSPWHEICSVAFGIGAGLTMDEFALWLNLKDVYWSEKGRSSIDAVIVCAAVAGLMLISYSAWVDVADSVETAVFAAVGFFGGVGLVLAIVNAAKEKIPTAVIGLFLAPVALFGAFRLGRPTSLWARAFYGEKRMERSRRRFGVADPPPQPAGEGPGEGSSAPAAAGGSSAAD